MKVVLTTLGRFHSFDLARQLHRRQALGAIYTGYPRFKLRSEGLPRSLVRTYPYVHAAYMASGWRDRIGLRLLRAWEYWDRALLDRHVAQRLPADTDVFVGLSGCGLATGSAARSRRIAYVCDRGSTHIRHQDDVMRAEHRRWGLDYTGIDPRIIEREEREYAAADLITVPSNHVRQTFLQRGVPAARVVVLPYGVDLDRFHPVGEPDPDRFDLLFVGGVNLRKGVPDLLHAFAALRHPRKSLTLAGGVDAATVELLHRRRLVGPQVRLVGHVPQAQLKALMSRSHALVLPSHEEGLAMVMAQAMACRCPVVATHAAGAADLYDDGAEGWIVDAARPADLTDRLQRLADDPLLRARMGAAALARVRGIGGWNDYGDRAMALYRGLCG